MARKEAQARDLGTHLLLLPQVREVPPREWAVGSAQHVAAAAPDAVDGAVLVTGPASTGGGQ